MQYCRRELKEKKEFKVKENNEQSMEIMGGNLCACVRRAAKLQAKDKPIGAPSVYMYTIYFI